MISIELWSDLACPYCWIGKHHLGQALAQVGDSLGPVQVNWRPFQLRPDAPFEPRDLREAMAERFGGRDKVDAMFADLQARARAEGLPMDMDRGQVSVNTLPAHRLLQLAARHDRADAVAEGLFRAHFAQGRNLADPVVLAEVGQVAGLDGEAVQAWLAGQEGLDALQAELARGRALGIQSVPTFVFNGRWALSGAQPVAVFVRALAGIAARPRDAG